MSSIRLLTWAVGLFALLVVKLALSTRRSKSLPPGPPTVPLFGNLLQIPTTKAYLQFLKWSQKYGAVISLKLGSNDLIVLNTASAVRDLFDKRGAIYSSRPPNHIGNELIARDNVHLLLMPYGAEWRSQRKVYQTILNINAVSSLRTLQSAEAVLTLKQLADSPENYYDHIRRYSTAVILSSVFGIRGPEFNHPLVQRLYHVQDQFTAILETGATPPVDVFPILKHLPDALSPWRKWALSIRAQQRELYFELLQNVKDRLQKGIHRNCFMDNVLEEHYLEKNNLDEEHVAYIGGVLMEGGSDTTASTLLSFLMAMLKYPHVLHKAQEDVDRVCGSSRSPNFEDVDKLPYMKNCVSEVLRWRPVAAGQSTKTQNATMNPKNFGQNVRSTTSTVSDKTTKNKTDCVSSMDLALADGFVLVNIWQKIRWYVTPLRSYEILERSLTPISQIINVSKLVWAFDILPGKDPIGAKQLSRDEVNDSIETAWTNGFLTAPKKFPLELRVRSAAHKETIEKDYREAKKTFQLYGD